VWWDFLCTHPTEGLALGLSLFYIPCRRQRLTGIRMRRGPVWQLVDDLLHATESYRALNLKHGTAVEDLATWKSNMEVLGADNAKLLKENNTLHMQVCVCAREGVREGVRRSVRV